MSEAVTKPRSRLIEITGRRAAFGFSAGNICRTCGRRYINYRARRSHERRVHGAGR